MNHMKTFLVVGAFAASLVALPAWAANTPGTPGQPNQSCRSATAPNTPGNAAVVRRDRRSIRTGKAGTVYAGQQPGTHSENRKSDAVSPIRRRLFPAAVTLRATKGEGSQGLSPAYECGRALRAPKPKDRRSRHLETQPFARRPMNGSRLAAAIMLVSIPAVGLPYGATNEEAGGGFVFEAVGRGAISNSIEATGTVEAVAQVDVSSAVSGLLDKVFVNFNDDGRCGSTARAARPRRFRSASERGARRAESCDGSGGGAAVGAAQGGAWHRRGSGRTKIGGGAGEGVAGAAATKRISSSNGNSSWRAPGRRPTARSVRRAPPATRARRSCARPRADRIESRRHRDRAGRRANGARKRPKHRGGRRGKAGHSR